MTGPVVREYDSWDAARAGCGVDEVVLILRGSAGNRFAVGPREVDVSTVEGRSVVQPIGEFLSDWFQMVESEAKRS